MAQHNPADKGEGSIYLPKPATVKSVLPMTADVKLFEVEKDDGSPLGQVPGQFVEVSLMGIGEAPISVSSSPSKKGASFELCVRAVGSVTNAMHRLKAGDKIGIRGPYGRGFDTAFLKGRDIIFVCGGLGVAPLRSLLNFVVDNRKDYGKVTVLYGCKKPSELLFCDEVRCQWKNLPNVEYHLMVDKVPEGELWEHNVCMPTAIIPKIEFNPKTTYAVICGPPVMYKFVIKSLRERGFPDDHIIISLERRMKCGVGKCGHCQINGLYACQSGPVFYFSEVKDLTEAL
jgi:sulfhydrogenase subunit gamma (sulfur reductase)